MAHGRKELGFEFCGLEGFVAGKFEGGFGLELAGDVESDGADAGLVAGEGDGETEHLPLFGCAVLADALFGGDTRALLVNDGLFFGVDGSGEVVWEEVGVGFTEAGGGGGVGGVEEFAECGVDEHVAAEVVFDGGGRRVVFHEGGETGFGFAQGLLGAGDVGDIAKDGDDTFDAVGIVEHGRDEHVPCAVVEGGCGGFSDEPRGDFVAGLGEGEEGGWSVAFEPKLIEGTVSKSIGLSDFEAA